MSTTPDTAPSTDREQQLSRTFVQLADTLVADFDIGDFLTLLVERSVDLLGVSAACVILLDEDGTPRVAATSSQRTELLELFAVQTESGPCIDCARTGVPVLFAGLPAETRRWPTFTAAARECGYRAAQALPMRLREQVIGVLTLFGTEPGGPAAGVLELGQALAGVATIGLLQQRTIEQGDRLAGQLKTALTSRVVIEQAKGVLAERGSVSMDEAFSHLRAHARSHHLRLTDLARGVVEGTADVAAILASDR
ncbi:GAF and ANTAR domain-containing protein [Amycolatopsis sp. PS_44_ISF1]|uniref:GAF and ANTAR domain-containing protein n=1 Tax=Amycolatopsis sp. PS_44_ISF1 TaxID=2974917 RepID=UPI0028E03238|nr:GAF and ANTAR domain-containing protein [Amycolatopsis sp. PS_44_ISF1]MDT8915223.1 GAF and ANTAR domain-containing protein [Amycolatopsis sp. PS_44_ISF1]